MKYFHVYRDGIKIFPIGIICITRLRGFGFGIWKYKYKEDLHIGLGWIFNIHIIHVNWKAL